MNTANEKDKPVPDSVLIDLRKYIKDSIGPDIYFFLAITSRKSDGICNTGTVTNITIDGCIALLTALTENMKDYNFSVGCEIPE